MRGANHQTPSKATSISSASSASSLPFPLQQPEFWSSLYLTKFTEIFLNVFGCSKLPLSAMARSIEVDWTVILLSISQNTALNLVDNEKLKLLRLSIPEGSPLSVSQASHPLSPQLILYSSSLFFFYLYSHFLHLPTMSFLIPGKPTICKEPWPIWLSVWNFPWKIQDKLSISSHTHCALSMLLLWCF